MKNVQLLLISDFQHLQFISFNKKIGSGNLKEVNDKVYGSLGGFLWHEMRASLNGFALTKKKER